MAIQISGVAYAAVVMLLLSACGTHRGWMQRDPFSLNRYVVPVPDHRAKVIVASPRGWRLAPDGAPVNLGSLVHSNHPLSPLVISTESDPQVVRTTSQKSLVTRFLEEARSSESERIKSYRELTAGLPPVMRPSAISRDQMTSHFVGDVTLRDGRDVSVTKFHSPSSGHALRAFIPEDGFVAAFHQPIAGPAIPREYLTAFTAVLRSYKVEKE